MRFVIFCLLVATALASHADENLQNLQNAKHYQSFSATVDAQMTLVPASADDHYYLYFENFGSELDDFVGLYQAVKQSTRADADVRYQLLGTSKAHLRNQHNATLLAGSRVEYLEALLPEKAPVKLFYAGKADIYKARKILALYDQRQGRLESGIAVRRLLKEKQDALEKACGKTFAVELGSFSDKSTPGLLQGHLTSLAQLCRNDQDYREAINAIETITVNEHPDDDGHSIELDDAQLHISFNRDTVNVGAASNQILRDVF